MGVLFIHPIVIVQFQFGKTSINYLHAYVRKCMNLFLIKKVFITKLLYYCCITKMLNKPNIYNYYDPTRIPEAMKDSHAGIVNTKNPLLVKQSSTPLDTCKVHNECANINLWENVGYNLVNH